MNLGIILCDLDDTLVDARWRMPLWGDWDAFYSKSLSDKPIEPMCDLVRYLCSSFRVIICTAREERFRAITQKKLDMIGIWPASMIMRPNDSDGLTSPVLKLMLAEKALGSNWRNRLSLVIDDREDVLSAFRSEGIFTLQATYAGQATPVYGGLEKIIRATEAVA